MRSVHAALLRGIERTLTSLRPRRLPSVSPPVTFADEAGREIDLRAYRETDDEALVANWPSSSTRTTRRPASVPASSGVCSDTGRTTASTGSGSVSSATTPSRSTSTSRWASSNSGGVRSSRWSGPSKMPGRPAGPAMTGGFHTWKCGLYRLRTHTPVSELSHDVVAGENHSICSR